MSNFSSLKHIPPVFQNITPEKAWKKLREPFSIAILASLGFHGLLWFGLPLIPSSNVKPTDQRTLQVVELSPLEQQARLPDTALLQPSITKPNSSTSVPSTSGVPLVPVDPALPDPNPYYQLPDRSSTTFGTTTPTKRGSIKSTTKPRKDPKQTKEPDENQPSSGDPDLSEPKTDSKDLLDENGKPFTKSREDQERLAALQKNFAFNTTGTSQQDFIANSAIAAQKIVERFSIRDWEKPVSITTPYPKEACQFQHESKPVQGTTGLIVVMLPDGTLGDTALLVKSSGFKGLDESARKYVEKQWGDIVKQAKLEPGSKPKALPLEIKVAPTKDDCSATAKPVS